MIRAIAALGLSVLVGATGMPAQGGQAAGAHTDHSGHAEAAGHSGHGGHSGHKFQHKDGVMNRARDYQRIRTSYDVPAIRLRDQSGEAVRLDRLLAREEPVLLQFIFTSCATICPVMSATFAQAQDSLRQVAPATRLISISIDPEYDTPARLRSYAARHRAGDNWTFLTGDHEKVFKVVRAFDALFESDNKMYHEPYTYMRAAPGAEWTRLNGLVGAAELTAEYRRVIEAAGDSLAQADVGDAR